MSQLFVSGGRSIGDSASASVLPKSIHDRFPLGLTGFISCCSRDSHLLQHHSSKAPILWHSLFFVVQLSHSYVTTEKYHSFDHVDLCQQRNVSAFNMMSRFVIAFLPRSKHLLISWLQSPSTVILKPPKIKCVTVSTSICHEVMGLDTMILVF